MKSKARPQNNVQNSHIMKSTGNKNYILLLILFPIVFSSCYTQRDKRLLQESRTLPNYKSEDYKDYILQVNDELVFRAISTDEDFIKLIDAEMTLGQNLTYRIFPDGTIDLPFINSIRVEGKTIPQAADEIRKRYQSLVSDVDIKLALANKTFTIIGEAGNGVFPIYKEKMNIYQALAQSGAIALSGDRKHIKIVRETNGEPEILEFDIRPKSIIDSKYYYIYPNDIIYVQKEPANFYKANSYGALLGLITSSISLFTTVYYFTKLNQ